MNPNKYRPAVKAMDWIGEDGTITPIIRIASGPVFVLIPYDRARAVVDAVHDACDNHERAQREKADT